MRYPGREGCYPRLADGRVLSPPARSEGHLQGRGEDAKTEPPCTIAAVVLFPTTYCGSRPDQGICRPFHATATGRTNSSASTDAWWRPTGRPVALTSSHQLKSPRRVRSAGRTKKAPAESSSAKPIYQANST